MKETLSFLSKLNKNNNREWFQSNKSEYQLAHQEMIAFADKLISEMNTHDVIETPSGKKSLFRIYRDVRFGKDKTPYKTHWAGFMRRAGADRRGGYYYRIGLNGAEVMGGFFNPNTQDLLHIRNQLAQDGDLLRSVIDSKQFKSFFGELLGEQLKTAPLGFEKDHPEIDLLRYKQFMIKHDFSREEMADPDFAKKLSHAFNQMRPFFDVMTEMLTTDLNGISLV
ncbi:DUF2461 domain-containing protein [Ekhidna sp. To15]|uniref:DUF2461 domain-containing protein n=1 Tax=Ekhidna sp. To15 TaxID=3395267 RepID=UPI003F528493